MKETIEDLRKRRKKIEDLLEQIEDNPLSVLRDLETVRLSMQMYAAMLTMAILEKDGKTNDDQNQTGYIRRSGVACHAGNGV